MSSNWFHRRDSEKKRPESPRRNTDGHFSSDRLHATVRLVHESLVADGVGIHCDDVDLQPAVYVDAVHPFTRRQTRRVAGAVAGDVLAADRPADFLLADPGVAGRSFRAAAFDIHRLRVVGPELGAFGVRHQYLDALS